MPNGMRKLEGEVLRGGGSPALTGVMSLRVARELERVVAPFLAGASRSGSRRKGATTRVGQK